MYSRYKTKVKFLFNHLRLKYQTNYFKKKQTIGPKLVIKKNF